LNAKKKKRHAEDQPPPVSSVELAATTQNHHNNQTPFPYNKKKFGGSGRTGDVYICVGSTPTPPCSRLLRVYCSCYCYLHSKPVICSPSFLGSLCGTLLSFSIFSLFNAKKSPYSDRRLPTLARECTHAASTDRRAIIRGIFLPLTNGGARRVQGSKNQKNWFFCVFLQSVGR